MRNARVLLALLGVEQTVLENVEFGSDGGGESGCVVFHVRPSVVARRRCGACRRRCARYDSGEGRRRWRALDLGTLRAFVEAEAPRVSCPVHGVVVAHVPWARHDAGHTFAFDQTVAWLATQTSKSAVTHLMRIAWRTVGSIIARVWADVEALGDRLDGLTKIGIDEISYKRGYLYITCVVDHETGRLVWAAPGRDRATLRLFFDQLGPERSARITHVSADAASWIAAVVTERCPDAVQCADAFHIVAWAMEALDDVRKQVYAEARKTSPTVSRGRHSRTPTGDARKIKHSRYALWKNPDKLTDKQRAKLAWIATTDNGLYRAYLLKEGLRFVFAVKGDAGKQALDRWLSWARRSQLPSFVTLARRIDALRTRIDATLEHGLSNARIESVNTKIRLITRIAFGFRSPQALIALAMLSLGGHRPTLPNRT